MIAFMIYTAHVKLLRWLYQADWSEWGMWHVWVE